MKPRTLLCLFGSVLLLTACGQNLVERAVEDAFEEEGQNADVQIDGEEVNIVTDEGTFSTGGELPDNWPSDVPVYPNATVAYAGTAMGDQGESNIGVTLTTSANVDDVWAFYEEIIPASGWKVETTMRSQGMNLIGGSKDNRILSVLIADAEGQTQITLGVGQE